MGDYPPGVSGNEWHLRGPVEFISTRTCPNCDYMGLVEIQAEGPPASTGPPTMEWWECPQCGREHETEIPPLEEDEHPW